MRYRALNMSEILRQSEKPRGIPDTTATLPISLVSSPFDLISFVTYIFSTASIYSYVLNARKIKV